ncbi:MAG: efflux RND transporter periplasmic adaptor subunit [Deltaproteobacteria bacterium]|nr:efflux RND transporter periplasmic adaptor subunit [Deltaproteobacteria bacterium]
MKGAHNRAEAVMAVVRWALLAAVFALAAGTTWRYWGPGDTHATHGPARFYCPMHPAVTSPDPGECPICHMRLEPIPQERTQRVLSGDAGVAPTAPMPTAPVMLALDRRQAIGVVTEAVTSRVVRDTLEVPAALETPEGARSEVHVRTPGFVERVLVRETGVRVSRGQTLALVYSPSLLQLQQELLLASRWGDAGLGGASLAARRALELNGMTAQDIDGVLRSGVPMRTVPLRASAGGTVLRRAILPGMYATPEVALYELAELSRLWVVARVPAAELWRVRRGLRAVFRADDGSATAEGTVERVEPSLDDATRSARVRVPVQNLRGALRPGQYGQVTLEGSEATAQLLIPRDALVDTGDARYVFVEREEGLFEPRAVRPGSLLEGRWWTVSGVREGERVVSRGAFLLDSESRLQAALSAAPTRDGGAP